MTVGQVGNLRTDWQSVQRALLAYAPATSIACSISD
jgi:hypothetical protein